MKWIHIRNREKSPINQQIEQKQRKEKLEENYIKATLKLFLFSVPFIKEVCSVSFCCFEISPIKFSIRQA